MSTENLGLSDIGRDIKKIKKAMSGKKANEIRDSTARNFFDERYQNKWFTVKKGGWPREYDAYSKYAAKAFEKAGHDLQLFSYVEFTEWRTQNRPNYTLQGDKTCAPKVDDDSEICSDRTPRKELKSLNGPTRRSR